MKMPSTLLPKRFQTAFQGVLRLPIWALIAGGAAALVIVPLVIVLITTPGGSSASVAPAVVTVTEVVELTETETERLDEMVELMRQGNYSAATHVLDNPLYIQLPRAGYTRVLDSLRAHVNDGSPRGALELYARTLELMLQRGVVVDTFESHVRILRHQALLTGGQELLQEVAGGVIEDPGLLDYYELLGVKLSSYLDLAAYFIQKEAWGDSVRVLDHIRKNERVFPENRKERFGYARLLARLYGASGDPKAKVMVQEFFADFAQDQGRATPVTGHVQAWLSGLVKYHAPVKDFDRGSRSLERAVVENTLSPGQDYFRIDYVRALRAEANLLEQSLGEEYYSSRGNRGDQLFTIGWGAARLGDDEELRSAAVRLGEDTGDPRGRGFLALLRGLLDIRTGNVESGVGGIREILHRMPDLLTGNEEAAFREIVATGKIPVATDRGRVSFQNGKIWADLHQSNWLETSKARIRNELRGESDVAYLTFLEAITAYRDDDVATARRKLYQLLDEDLPPDLTRGEVAALIVLTEEREQELQDIVARRRTAMDVLTTLPRETFLPLVTLAQVIRWQIQNESSGGEYIFTEEGMDQLTTLETKMDSLWLVYFLQEKRLELQQELLDLTRRLRDEGSLVAALETLERASSLVRSRPTYNKEKGWILSRMAEGLPASEEVEKKRLYQEAGEAFASAAGANLGEVEYYFHATEQFLLADDLRRAYATVNLYSPRLDDDPVMRQRYWRSQVQRVQLARKLGNHGEAERIIEQRLRSSEAGQHRYELILERGLCAEARGYRPEALADYELIYDELDPTSRVWRHALHRRARILHFMVQSSPDRDPVDQERRRRSLGTWEELAAWTPAEDAPVALAEAHYEAGEGRSQFSEYSRARRHFQKLLDLANETRDRPRTRSESKNWALYEEKARYSLADTYFMELRFDDAQDIYRAVVNQFPASPRAPYGYLQLGECETKKGNREEALRYFRLGERKVSELEPEVFQSLLPRRGKAFWERTFREKIRALEL